MPQPRIFGAASDDPAGIAPVSPAEFVAGIGGTSVIVGLADLVTVHDYARHFDCDDDPSMIRIRQAIERAEQAVSGHGSPGPASTS